MAESNQNEIVARLWKLPGQLLVALINGTAILVIVAAILALVVFSRLEHLAGDVSATMTEAVLARLVPEPQQALANLAALTAEVRALGGALEAEPAEDVAPREAEVARLREGLAGLQASIERLTSARDLLTDEAIARIGDTVTGALERLRSCRADTADLQTAVTSRPRTPT